MTDPLSRLAAALAERYRIEREIGSGGMATVLAAQSRGSADVPEGTQVLECRFSDTRRAVASATCPAAIWSSPCD